MAAPQPSASPADRPFWEQPLDSLDKAQWEALCDGCGKCCLHKVEEDDAESDEIRIFPTNVACRLLDLTTARCSNYRQRKRYVKDCLQLSAAAVADIAWLPLTCAYRLRAHGQPLPDWHYLISGDREAVHRAGESVRGWTISEVLAGPLEQHVVTRAV